MTAAYIGQSMAGLSRSVATAAGLAAVLMWSLLALMTAASGAVPPFQLMGFTITIGAAVGLIWIARTSRWADLRQPWPVYLLGVFGLFGNHALYFVALRYAPPLEAALIVDL